MGYAGKYPVRGKFTKQAGAETPSISTVPGLIEAITTHGAASEKTVMAEITDALEELGIKKPVKGNDGLDAYYVLAGQRNTKHAGSDSGVADLHIYLKGHAVQIEVKARNHDAKIKPAQLRLWKAGCLHIVNTVEQVLEILNKHKESKWQP